MLIQSNFIFNIYYKIQHIIIEPDLLIQKKTQVNISNYEVQKFHLNEEDIDIINNADYIKEQIKINYGNNNYLFDVFFDDEKKLWIIKDSNFDIFKDQINLELNIKNNKNNDDNNVIKI